MDVNDFLWHAKRGHGECILAMKQEDISLYKEIVKKIFLNNYAFLINDEYRSSYACELISFYNDDKYFLNLLWKKIEITNLDDYYTYDYLINNLYFILNKNKKYDYTDSIKHLLIKKLNKETFTLNENNSMNSLMSLIIDLNINIDIKEILSQYYANFKNTNLDLSCIEDYYKISLANKKNNCNLINKEILLNFNMLLECISNNSCFNKQFPFIVDNISDKYLKLLLDLLNDNTINSSLKTNILKIVLYSKKRDIQTMNKIIEFINKSTQEQKKIIYEILVKTKSKKIFYKLYLNSFNASFVIRFLLNNYSEDKYEEVHDKILKIKINYSNSDNWFEVENDLIKYFNRKNIDKRLLCDLKHFLKNGLSSTSRYKIALILKKYNMLDDKEIKVLRYDANYKIRQKFSLNQDFKR